MLAVLVVHPDPTRRNALARAARDAGPGTEVHERDALPPAPLRERYDVIVAELSTARRAGLLRATPPRPLVLLCAEFPARDLTAGEYTVLLPNDPAPEALRAAIRDALEGLAPTAAQPASSPSPSARDARAPTDSRAVESADDLDAVAELVARALGGPAVIVSVLDPARQHFLGQYGLPPDMVAAEGIPLAWSSCRHTAALSAPLVARDAREHPLLGENPLIQMSLYRAYAGVPFAVEGGAAGAVGTVCAVDDQAREFDTREVAVLQLAARLSSEILARRAARGEELTVGKPGAGAAGEQEIAVGSLLDGKYLVTAALGRGGQAEVFLGRDRLVGQLVAIKLVSGSAGDDEALLREASTLAGVRHEGVVRMYGWGRTPRGKLFIVLEYLEGETLAARLRTMKRGEMPADEALSVVRQVADALAALHARGIVHGDVKPGNVMLDARQGRAVLFDFGVARTGTGAEGSGPAHGGTPGFSAPEQFEGGALTPRADVYALAALAYQLLAGRAPFVDVPLEARVFAQREGGPPAVSEWRRGAGAELDALFEAAMSPRAEDRPETVGAFVERLARALE